MSDAPNGMRTTRFFPNSRDTDFVKKQAFHDQRMLVVNLDDPKIGWDERQLLENIGVKLYGKRS